jgi:1,4-dihydroxy-2-naphthoate octaprenyltransferase
MLAQEYNFIPMSTLSSYFLAARPKTLSATLMPVWAGCLIVQKMTGTWDLPLAVYTVLCTMCLQIACNLFNDAIDFTKSADTKARVGPRRMTATGQLSSRQVTIGALAFLVLACLLSIPLIQAQGWPILAIGIPSLFFAYGYTGGPYPLAYNGLGEVFVILFFGLVAVLGTILVQIGTSAMVPGSEELTTLSVYNAGFVIGIQCGLLCAVMISVNNLRDRKEDSTTGKRTLAVRLGDARARRLTQSFIVAAYITLPTAYRALQGVDFSKIWWHWIPAVLLGIYLMRCIQKTPANEAMNRVLALSSIHLIVYFLTYTFS